MWNEKLTTVILKGVVSEMNEPIISPWIFYWLEVLHKFTLFLVVGAIISASSLLVLLLQLDKVKTEKREARWKENDIAESEDVIRAQSSVKKCCKIFTILIILVIVVPSPETITKMLIAKHFTPYNLEVTGETFEKVIDKAVEKIINASRRLKE